MTAAPDRIEVHRADADGIPLIWARGEARNTSLVIWLPFFGGDKDACAARVRDLAGRGFTAISFDPFQHGERAIESGDDRRRRILGNIRKHFWPILGRTCRDVSLVIDWAIARFGVRDVGMGGISMGGDITVAAMGHDRRIAVGTPCLATPDWLRPGSVEPPGSPDDAASAEYRAHDPITHIASYGHCPGIYFENGELDMQVPAEASTRFARELQLGPYRDHPERVAVTLHAGVGHDFTDTMWANCLERFSADLRG